MPADHGSRCRELRFRNRYVIPEPAQVALEDYAREVARVRAAEIIRDAQSPLLICGVHLCDLSQELAEPATKDIEDFAADLARAGVPDGGGLGWG